MVAFNNDQIANFLVYEDGNRATHWSSNSITVNFSGLPSAVKTMARLALSTWEDLTGVSFNEVSFGAQITFDDERAGAYASSYGYVYPNDIILTDVDINVSKNWIQTYGIGTDTYSFQTYVHEIGHALGLGHAGHYNGSAVFGRDNHYDNDSWQTSVMSYFSQTENTFTDASFAFVITPMIADVLAMWDLYGRTNNLRDTNTVYGVGSTAGGVYDEISRVGHSVAFNIVDDGGWDIIDFSNDYEDQSVNLNAEEYSDVYGLVGNMAIMRHTMIEQYNAGQGNDTITGNSATNILNGNGGNDVIYSKSNGSNNNTINGGNGNDTIYLANGSGADTVNGDVGNDTAVVRNNTGSFTGGVGIDTVRFVNAMNTYLLNTSGGNYEFFNVLTGKTFTVSNDVERFEFSNGSLSLAKSELASATQITDIETTGTALRHAKQGIYLIGGNATDIVVTKDGGVVGEGSITGWSAIHAQSNGSGGYNLLWKSDNGAFYEWSLNDQGTLLNGAAIANVVDREIFYGADLNNDGTIGHATSSIESNGSNELFLSTRGMYLIDGVTEITKNGVAMGPDSIPGWTPVQVEASGGGYRVLWQNTSGSYYEWALDGQGELVNGSAVANVIDVEAFYGVDLNNDGQTGHFNMSIESNGSNELFLSTRGMYLIDGVTEITKNGVAMGPDSIPGWTPVQVEASGGGYRVLWQNTSGSYYEWALDGQGELVNGSTVANVIDVEAFYGVDLNNDGQTGHFNMSIESNGSNELFLSTRGMYLIDGVTEITKNGVAMGPDSIPGWTPVQVEASGGGYRVLWQNTSGSYYEWALDGQGELVNGSAVANVANVESFYGFDVDGNGSIGLTAVNHHSQTSGNYQPRQLPSNQSDLTCVGLSDDHEFVFVPKSDGGIEESGDLFCGVASDNNGLPEMDNVLIQTWDGSAESGYPQNIDLVSSGVEEEEFFFL